MRRGHSISFTSKEADLAGNPFRREHGARHIFARVNLIGDVEGVDIDPFAVVGSAGEQVGVSDFFIDDERFAQRNGVFADAANPFRRPVCGWIAGPVCLMGNVH